MAENIIFDLDYGAGFETDEEKAQRKKELEIYKKPEPATEPNETWAKAPVQQPKAVQESIDSYYNSNIDLAAKISGASGDKYKRVNTAMNTMVRDNINSQILYKPKFEMAKEAFSSQYGREGNQAEVDNFLNNNRLKIEKSLYGSLTSQALKSNVDFDKGGLYQGFLADTLKTETPKQEEESFKDKATNVLKGAFVDTPAGFGALFHDSFNGKGDTDWYKSYFQERTKLKEGASFGDKAIDLLFTQGAVIDVAIGIGTFLTWGAAAAPLLAMKTSMGFGLKGVGKGIAKSVGSEAVEAFSENVGKNVLKNFGSSLSETTAKELAETISEKGGKLMTTSIDKIAKETGLGHEQVIKTLARTIRETGSTLPDKIQRSLAKEVDTMSRFSGIALNTVKSKFGGLDLLDTVGDVLGLPTSIVKLSSTGAKVSFAPKAAFMTAGLPLSTLLPGVGGFIQDNILGMGNAIAHKYIESTRGGLIESERQGFIDKYGIDPEQAQGQLKDEWNNYINYKLKYSTVSESFGVKFDEQSLAWKIGYGLVDNIANFAGVYAGMKAIGHAHGISKQYTDPFHVDAAGNVVSNIKFIRELEQIQNDPSMTSAQKGEAIDQLKSNLGDPSYFTLVKSTKELSSLIEEANTIMGSTVAKGSILDAEARKIFQQVETLAKQGKGKEAIELWIKESETLNKASQSLFSNGRLEQITQKIEVIDTYMNKVRESQGALNDFKLHTAANISLKKDTDLAKQFVDGNKEMVTRFLSSIGEAINTNKKIVESFGKMEKAALMNKDVPQVRMMYDKVVDVLKNDWYNIEDAKEIASHLSNAVNQALTKVYLDLGSKGGKDIAAIFNKAFQDFGVNIKGELQNVSGAHWNTSVGKILLTLRWEGADGAKKLDRAVMNILDLEIQKEMILQENINVDLTNVSEYITQMNSLFSETTYQLHIDRNNQRLVAENGPEKIEVNVSDEIKSLEDRIAKLEEEAKTGVNVDEEVAEIKKDIETLELAKEQDGTVIKTVELPEARKDEIIENTTEIAQPIVDKTAEDNKDTVEIIEKLKQSQAEKIQTIIADNDSYLKAHKQAWEDRQKNSRLIEEASNLDDPILKENDSYYQNGKLFEHYNDVINAALPDLNGTMQDFFNNQREFNLDSVKAFDKEYGTHLQTLYDDLITKDRNLREDAIKYDEKDDNRKLAAIRRMQNAISENIRNDFSRENINRMAHDSDTAEQFAKKMSDLFKKRYSSNDEMAKKFLDNSFGIGSQNLHKMFNLYKNTVSLTLAQVNLSGDGTMHLSSNPASKLHFANALGEEQSTLRIDGLRFNEMRKAWWSEPDSIVLMDTMVDKDGNIIDTNVFLNSNTNGNNPLNEWISDFNKVIEKMEENGYVFLGSFQEEGKKNVFIKRLKNDSVEKTFNKWLATITGMDVKTVEKIRTAPNAATIVQNLIKRLKLSAWWEIKPDPNLWNKYTQIDKSITNKPPGLAAREPGKLITLFFNDSQDGIKTHDGSSYISDGARQAMNLTNGANKNNTSFKPVINYGKGNWGKEQMNSMNESRLQDVNIARAITAFAEKNPNNGLIEIIGQYGADWRNDSDARYDVLNHIENFKLIDHFEPLSNVKNIFTGSWLSDDPTQGGHFQKGVDFTEHEEGSILQTDIQNVGFKMQDFYKSPDDLANEMVKMPNNFARSIHKFNDITEPEVILKAFNDMKTRASKEMTRIIDSIENGNPFSIIADIEKTFGVKYSDYTGTGYMTARNKEMILNFLSNIARSHTIAGTKMKGNNALFVPLPDLIKNSEVINKYLENKLPDQNTKNNWILVDRNYYSHYDELAKDDGVMRIFATRNPIASAKSIAMPHVVYVQDIWGDGPGQLPRTDMPQLDNGMAASDQIRSLLSGDFDGDKVTLIYDKDFLWTKANLVDQADFVMDQVNRETGFFAAETKKDAKKFTSTTFEGLWKEVGFDVYRGKKNIGVIDSMYNRYVSYYKAGLLNITDEIFFQNLKKFEDANLKAVDNLDPNISTLEKIMEKALSSNVIKHNGRIRDVILDVNKAFNVNVQFPWSKHSVNVWHLKFKNIDDIDEGDIVTLNAFIKRNWYKVPWKDGKEKNNIVNLSKTDKDTQAFRELFERITLDPIEIAIDNVYGFIGKNDFSSGAPKGKKIQDLQKKFSDIEPSLEYLKNNYPEAIEWDSHIKFLVENSEFFKQDLTTFGKGLQTTIDKTFEKAKNVIMEKFQNNYGFLDTEIKADLDKKLKAYWKIYFDIKDSGKEIINWEETGKTVKMTQEQKVAYAEARTKAKKEILQIFRDHPDVNKDLYILDYATSFNQIRNEFMDRWMIDLIDREMVRGFAFINSDKLHDSETYGSEMQWVTKYFGQEDPKSHAERMLKAIEKKTEWIEEFQKNPEWSAISKNKLRNEKSLAAQLSSLGIIPRKDIASAIDRFKVMTPEDRKNIFTTLSTIKMDTDMEALIKTLGDQPEIIRDILKQKAAFEQIGMANLVDLQDKANTIASSPTNAVDRTPNC